MLALADATTEGYRLLGPRLDPADVETAVDFFDQLDRPAVADGYQAEFDGVGSARRLRKVRRLVWNEPDLWGPVLVRAGAIELARELLGDGAAVVFHAAFLKPAVIGSAVPLHQDQALWQHSYPGAFSMWFALTDVHPDNGGLFGSPGSHREGTRPHRARAGTSDHPSLDAAEDGLAAPQPFVLSPGDALAWDRNFAHGSGPNTSSSDRRGMVVVFADSTAPGFASRDLFTLDELAAAGRAA